MSAAPQTLYETIEVTWPCASSVRLGPFTIRDGAGGGKRVSAATAEAEVAEGDLAKAEEAMVRLEQPALFMIRKGDTALDALLAERGYSVIDPVNIYLAPVAPLAAAGLPRGRTFTIWEPLQIMRDIWAEGGIGPARVAVMVRAGCPKTGLFGRYGNRPSAAGYVGLNHAFAMVHALQVRPRDRRCGMGRLMMQQAARWAEAEGAEQLAVMCTQANVAANALYASMGFDAVGGYHYRIKG
jgi:GNAT superfamily N-acetyltransferase